jgi:DNA-binding MarR family transcriptional regulator
MGSQAGSTLAVDGVSGQRATVTAELLDEVMRFVRLLKASATSAGGLDKASLMLLWPLRDGPKRVRDLADAKGVDQSTVSRQVAQLVKVGLVRRDSDPGDRRASLLVLTDRGREMCQEMIDARRQAIADALADWADDRIGQFAGLFRDFNSAVESQAVENQAVEQHANRGQAADNHHKPS